MSVKQNYFYSLLNTISGLLFPIVTFPYVARILMADGIGQVNFYLSIINYISMFAGLGIPTYAIREIARVKSNVKEMNQVAVEILLLHTFLTLLGYIALHRFVRAKHLRITYINAFYRNNIIFSFHPLLFLPFSSTSSAFSASRNFFAESRIASFSATSYSI